MMRFDQNTPQKTTGPHGTRSALVGLILGLGLAIGFTNCIQAPDLTGYPCGTNKRCPPPLICDPGTNTCQPNATDGGNPSDGKADKPPEARTEASIEPQTETGAESNKEPPPDRAPTADEIIPEPKIEKVQETKIEPTPERIAERNPPESRPEPSKETTVEKTPETVIEPQRCSKTPSGSSGQCSNPGECCLNECITQREPAFPLGVERNRCTCKGDLDCATGYKCCPGTRNNTFVCHPNKCP